MVSVEWSVEWCGHVVELDEEPDNGLEEHARWKDKTHTLEIERQFLKTLHN